MENPYDIDTNGCPPGISRSLSDVGLLDDVDEAGVEGPLRFFRLVLCRRLLTSSLRVALCILAGSKSFT